MIEYIFNHFCNDPIYSAQSDMLVRIQLLQ